MPGTIGDLPSTLRELHMATNAELLKDLKLAPRARFYLCDLHVHSPASSDVSCGERFDFLSQDEKQLLEQIADSNTNEPVQYDVHATYS